MKHVRGVSFAAVHALALASCFSFSNPPAVSRDTLIGIAETHFHATVGVFPYKWPIYSQNLCDVLRATNMFDRVDPLESVIDPDLVVYVTGTPSHANPLPFTSIISLGLFPVWDEDEWGEVFAIRAYAPGAKEPDPAWKQQATRGRENGLLRIDSRYTGQLHMGWFAAFTGLLPGRTWFLPRGTRRYREWVAAHLYGAAPAIRALIDDARSQRRSGQ